MSLCSSLGCSDPHTHLTRAHVCRRCLRLGHGDKECGPGLRARIYRHAMPRSSDSSSGPFSCTKSGCADPTSHHSNAHFCGRCLSTGLLCCYPCVTSRIRAPLPPPPPPDFLKGVKCPICRAQGTADLASKLYTGMSCCICTINKPLCAVRPCGHVRTCRSCMLRMTLDPLPSLEN